MKLQVLKRSADRKGETNHLRRTGYIPAIVYHQGRPSENIAVEAAAFQAVMRGVLPGRLSTTRFILVEGEKERQVVVKEIQYHVATYEVLHLDFEELHENAKINIKVPIECAGTMDCVGIRLGGALRQVIRYLLVSGFPKDLPDVLELDVRAMNLHDSKRLSELQIPAGVKPLMNLNEVAVVMVKR
jgi:large subunit ribosomal protein L25